LPKWRRRDPGDVLVGPQRAHGHLVAGRLQQQVPAAITPPPITTTSGLKMLM